MCNSFSASRVRVRIRTCHQPSVSTETTRWVPASGRCGQRKAKLNQNDSEHTRRSAAAKLHPNALRTSTFICSILAHLLDEQWTDPPITSIDVDRGGYLIVADANSETSLRTLCTLRALRKGIVELAHVATLTARERMYLLTRLPCRRSKQPARISLRRSDSPAEVLERELAAGAVKSLLIRLQAAGNPPVEDLAAALIVWTRFDRDWPGHCNDIRPALREVFTTNVIRRVLALYLIQRPPLRLDLRDAFNHILAMYPSHPSHGPYWLHHVGFIKLRVLHVCHRHWINRIGISELTEPLFRPN